MLLSTEGEQFIAGDMLDIAKSSTFARPRGHESPRVAMNSLIWSDDVQYSCVLCARLQLCEFNQR